MSTTNKVVSGINVTEEDYELVSLLLKKGIRKHALLTEEVINDGNIHTIVITHKLLTGRKTILEVVDDYLDYLTEKEEK